MGAPKDSRTDSGCFALTGEAIRPNPRGEISLEEFLAMLRFEQRHKLMELGYRDQAERHIQRIGKTSLDEL